MSERAELMARRQAAAGPAVRSERAELEALRASAPRPAPMSMARGILRGINQGLTLGSYDEIVAGLGGGEGETFEERRSSIDRPYKEFREGSLPGRFAGSAAELTGGILSGLGVPGLVRAAVPGAAGAAQRMYEGVASNVGQGLRRSAALGASGAATGGTYGGMSAEPGSRSEGAIAGAALGGLLGGATPIVGEVARVAGGGIRRATEGAKASAGRRLESKIAESGMTPAELTERARKMGGPVMLADLTPGLQRELEVTVARPGAGSQVAEGALTTRSTGAYERIAKTLNDVLGQGKDWFKATQQLRSDTNRIVGPMYREIADIPVTVEAQFMESPSFQKALRTATSLARDMSTKPRSGMGEAEVKLLEGIEAAAKARSAAPGVPLKVVDLIKRGLYSVEEGQKAKAVLTGKAQTVKGKASGDVRTSFVDSIDAQLGGPDPAVNPYFAARKVSQGFEQDNAAFHLGRRYGKFEPEELGEKVSQMSDSEKMFLRLGVMRELRNKLGSAPAKAAQLSMNPGQKQRLQVVLGDDYPGVQKFVEDELVMRQTESRALAGSPTARRLLGAEDQEAAEATAALRGPTEGIMGILSRARDTAMGSTPAQQEILARLLTTQGVGGIEELLRGVRPVDSQYILAPRVREAARRAVPLLPVVGAEQ